MQNDTQTTTLADIHADIETFMGSWDSQEWMTAHGSWASEEWDDRREAYTEAVSELAEMVSALPIAEHVDRHTTVSEILAAVEAVKEAAAALEGQVTPDEADYIAEGVIDPDGVSDAAESLEVGSRGQGWDCIEGWEAYRHGRALYMRWWRKARGARHGRDLWVLVDGDYFPEAS